jgi:hypothetical protein
MIWFLFSLALGIESTDVNAVWTKVVLRNTSSKTVTAFRLKQLRGLTRSRDLWRTEGIAPQAVYSLEIPTQDTAGMQIVGVVFADGSTEGAEASVLLARREGILRAEQQTAGQVRQFLQFHPVLDDGAMAELDRELESTPLPPATWISNQEKAAWNEGYVSTRRMIRERLGEVEPNRRRMQLEALGGLSR